MTQPTHGRENLTELHAELGPSNSRLHVDYTRQRGEWTRTEQTYRLGYATSDQFHVAIDDPVNDLRSRVFAWGGPVAIEVCGVDPADLAAALHPALSQVSIRINGQDF